MKNLFLTFALFIFFFFYYVFSQQRSGNRMALEFSTIGGEWERSAELVFSKPRMVDIFLGGSSQSNISGDKTEKTVGRVVMTIGL